MVFYVKKEIKTIQCRNFSQASCNYKYMELAG